MRRLSVAVLLAALSGAGAATAADLPPPVTFAPPPVMTAPTPLAFNWSGFYLGAHGGWSFGKEPFVDGAVAGGQVGVNYQYGGYVIGAEGDAGWADWEGADSAASLRLRAGFASGRFLVYATGGLAFADFDNLGWVAGGGLEYALSDHWTVGAEYLYYEIVPGESDVFRGRVNYLFGGLAGVPMAMTSPTPVGFNWSGFYFGGHGGYSFVSGTGLSDGLEAGGQLGVNHQMGSLVAGLEIAGGYVHWGPVHTIGSVRLRAGYAFDRFLAYAAGGLGIEDTVGWTLGGGVEYALTDHWIIGAEYLHDSFVGDHQAEIIRGRVSYLFNSPSGY